MIIETLVLDYLSEHFDNVYMERPKDIPNGRYIIIEKTGSRNVDKLHKSSFAIQSYGVSLYDTCLFNDEVKNVMYGIIELDEITKVSLNTDYNFTKTNTKEYRYQALFEITHY